ncbi:MAG TPA: DNA-3-methyladenine glycosylase I [Flavobacterium sp.]|nr:DNA-3-methyladenine glycosylase I [Flavobacterium sp.]
METTNNDGKIRCKWCVGDQLSEQYHDFEWGVPVYDDRKLFEFLVLETFQAGLSWITILRKRENFRNAFDGFDYIKVAQYNEEKIQQLMNDAGIIRNQLKIRAAVSNAIAFIEAQKEFGSFSNYIWKFTNGEPVVNKWKFHSEIPATTPLSDEVSKSMKKRGFKFVGSTVIYAHMQATGMINDHVLDCWKRNL